MGEGELSPWVVAAKAARERAGAPRDDGQAPDATGPATNLRLSVGLLVVGPVQPGQLRVGKTSLTMDGGKLLWDGQEKPRKRDAVLVATPLVPADPGTNTYVSVAVPDDVRDRFLGGEPLGLDLMCEPDGSGTLRFWLLPTHTTQRQLGSSPGEGSRPGAVWTPLKMRAPSDAWQGMVLGIQNPESQRIATFLVFWKPYTWSGPLIAPVNPPQAPWFTLRQSGKPGAPESVDPNRQYSLRVKFIEAPKDEIEAFASELDPLQGAEVSPNDVRAFRIDEEQLGIRSDKLNEPGHAALLSAPRVTFPMRHGQPEPEHYAVSDMAKVFPNYSPSLDAFLQRRRFQAIIADVTSTPFRQARRTEPRIIPAGIVVAVGGRVGEDPDTPDFELYCNHKELRPHARGLAFWRPHVLPDVVECPTELRCRFHSGDKVALVRPIEDPAKLLLLVVELDRVNPKDIRQFSESDL